MHMLTTITFVRKRETVVVKQENESKDYVNGDKLEEEFKNKFDNRESCGQTFLRGPLSSLCDHVFSTDFLPDERFT